MIEDRCRIARMRSCCITLNTFGVLHFFDFFLRINKSHHVR
jgi:hypothetical protein